MSSKKQIYRYRNYDEREQVYIDMTLVASSEAKALDAVIEYLSKLRSRERQLTDTRKS